MRGGSTKPPLLNLTGNINMTRRCSSGCQIRFCKKITPRGWGMSRASEKKEKRDEKRQKWTRKLSVSELSTNKVLLQDQYKPYGPEPQNKSSLRWKHIWTLSVSSKCPTLHGFKTTQQKVSPQRSVWHQAQVKHRSPFNYCTSNNTQKTTFFSGKMSGCEEACGEKELAGYRLRVKIMCAAWRRGGIRRGREACSWRQKADRSASRDARVPSTNTNLIQALNSSVVSKKSFRNIKNFTHPKIFVFLRQDHNITLEDVCWELMYFTI